MCFALVFFFSLDYASLPLSRKCPDFWSFMLLFFGPHWHTCSLDLVVQNLVWIQYLEVFQVLSKGKTFFLHLCVHLLTNCSTHIFTYKVVLSQLFLIYVTNYCWIIGLNPIFCDYFRTIKTICSTCPVLRQMWNSSHQCATCNVITPRSLLSSSSLAMNSIRPGETSV